MELSPARRRIIKGAIAAGVICLTFGAIIALVRSNWTHHQQTLGPTRIAATRDGGWWVVSHHQLHRFSAAGQRVLKVSLDDLGVDDPTAGFGVLEDGRVLITQTSSPRLLICNERAESCKPLLIRRKDGPLQLKSVALVQGVAANRFVASDSDGGRLLLIEADGRLIAERAQSTTTDSYRVPYQPRLSSDGELLLPNRADRKIMRFGTDSLEARNPAFPTGDAATARRGRVLPIDVARTADGRWWVLNARQCLCDGDLIERDPQAQASRRIELKGAGDLRALAAVGDRLLMADQHGAQLVVYDTRSGLQIPDIDPAFLAELEQVRRKRQTGNPHVSTILLVLIGGPLVGVLLLVWAGERLTILPLPPARPGAQAAPIGPGITWIGITPAHDRTLRHARVMGIVLCAAVAVGEAFLLVDAKSIANAASLSALLTLRHAAYVAAVLVLTAGAAITARNTRRLRKQRIGTDGTSLYYERGDGACESVLLTDVLTDGRILLMGKRTIMLRNTRQDCFDVAHVSSLILARLPKRSFLSRWRFMLATVQRNPLPWLMMIAGLGAIVLLKRFR